MSNAQLVTNFETIPQARIIQERTRWYAIQVRCRFEKKASRQLFEKGIEAFVPTQKQRRRWSDRRHTVEFPVFPGYAFVHVDPTPTHRLQVLQTQGVMTFVAFGGELIPISDKQIDDIRALSSHDVPYSAYPFIKVGRRVRIRGGCLDGIEGVCVSNNRDKMLVISIEPIQQSIAISLKDYGVEPA